MWRLLRNLRRLLKLLLTLRPLLLFLLLRDAADDEGLKTCSEQGTWMWKDSNNANGQARRRQ
jgi:hypothetical protein